MNCRRADALMQQGLDGPMSGLERERLDAHLAGCETCRVARAEYRRLGQMSDVWTRKTLTSDALGDAFTEGVMAQIAARAVPSPAPNPFRLPRFVLAGASLAFVIALSFILGPLVPSGAVFPSVPLAAGAFVAPARLTFPGMNVWHGMNFALPGSSQLWLVLIGALIVNGALALRAARTPSP